MEIITREGARTKNLKHYFTGKPCKHGHVSPRLVSSASCCKCINVDASNRYYHKKSLNERLWFIAKKRAAKSGLEFSITPDDVEVPEFCPILGIKLEPRVGRGFNGNAASIDRIDNTKGYTSDNIVVVSFRANSLKKDASFEELESIVEFYRRYHAKI